MERLVRLIRPAPSVRARLRMAAWITTCGLIALAAAGEARKPELPHGGTLAPMKQAPVLDGKIEPGEWDYAIRTVNFMSIFSQTMDPREGAMMLGFHGDRLYIAVISELPPRPAKGPYSAATTRDANVIGDMNAVELWLDPNRDRRDSGDGDQAFYQLFVNTLGATEDARIVPGTAPDKGWNPDVQSAHGLDSEKKIWTAEISIAMKDLGMNPAKLTGSSMGVLVSRNYKLPWHQVTAFPHQVAFVSWRHYPRFFFTADEPMAAIQSLGERFFQAEPDIRLAIRNPGPARKAKVALHLTSSDMPDLNDEKELDLPAGGTADYRFAVPRERLHVKDIDHAFTLRVQSADSQKTWFDYAAKWSHDPLTTIGWTTARRSVETKWDLRTTASPSESLTFSVYPSYHRVKIGVNATTMVADPEGEDAGKLSDSAEVSMKSADGKELAKATLSWVLTNKETSASRSFDLKDIPEGEYTFTAVFNKQPDQPVTKKYLRRKFPFEGNTIGITDTIYPPFEPVVTEADQVKVVCREYSVGDLGLWKSVKSLDKELLAGPIVLKVKSQASEVGGQNDEQVLTGVAKRVKSTPVVAVYEGEAQHPSVTVKSRCTTEMDGCMKVELTLLPGTGQVPGAGVQSETRPLKPGTLASLWLEIPLQDKLAPLWHCATTGLRNNPVGTAPQGSGVVWDSTRFPDGSWIGNFKPYLWLGGTDRGLCWFANNDRGWVLNVNERRVFSPCLELSRTNGVLTLKVNLVQKPITLTEPRTIVFGLMASPGKPMPADWRSVQFSGTVKGHALPIISYMGSQYWGSDETFCAAYPRNADLSILDAIQRIPGTPGGDLARESGKKFLDDWAERNFQTNMPLGGKGKDQILHLANLCVNVWGPARGPGYHTAYWDEYHGDSPLHPERQVFGGEWSDNVMARSRQDFRAYWGAEFVKRNFGLYFDNAWPRAARDTLTSDAYVIPGFGVQPSASIWEQRDYHRRIWNIHKEFGPKRENKPIQMIHMTNSQIIPYLTWSDSTLDLEWFYGPEPQQSKYHHGLLRAESASRQSGCYPCVLARIEDVKTPEQSRMAYRSRFGAMAVHEIKAEGSSGLFAPLYDMGYGTTNCVVYNYWDEAYPVAVSDPEVKTLLLKNGTELMLVICSWRNNSLTATFTFDTQALGVTPAGAADAEDPVGTARQAIAEAEKKAEDVARAVAQRQKDVAANKPGAAKTLADAQKDEQTAREALATRQKALPQAETTARNIVYDAAASKLSLPLEGYGVRIVRLK